MLWVPSTALMRQAYCHPLRRQGLLLTCLRAIWDQCAEGSLLAPRGGARQLYAAHLCLWKQACLQVSFWLCIANTRVLRSCRCCAVRPMFLPSWVWDSSCCCQMESKCQVPKRRAGGHPCGAGPLKKQGFASCRPVCGLVPDWSAVSWPLGSILLEFGFFSFGGFGRCFFPFL